MEICEKDYAQLCDSVKKGPPTIIRIPFTYDEINTLWDNLDFPYVDMILISLYSGWRSQELASIKYERYYGRFQKVMTKLNMKHMPHDTRHTFISEGKEKNMNEYVLKLIVGHSIQDVTEKVYTHRQIDELKQEIEKITYKK